MESSNKQIYRSHFYELWAELPHRYQNSALLETEDGTEYDWESVNCLVIATVNWLSKTTLPLDRVLIATEICPELLIVIWACWLSNRIAVPVDTHLPDDIIQTIFDRTSPSIIFTHKIINTPHYHFDSLATDVNHAALFSDQIQPYIDQEITLNTSFDSNAGALLLFTSGSTGQPKAVLLNQSGLLHSAQALAQHFSWCSGNRLLSLGPAHTMSGLRNPAVAALISGSSIILPDSGVMHPGRLIQFLKNTNISHVATVPALLQQLLASKHRLLGETIPTQLQQIICTGQHLPNPIRQEVIDWLKTPIYSYYGLTETGGICTADKLQMQQQGNLGVPLGAIAQVIDKNNQVVKKCAEGELRIHSPANMIGYWESSTVSSVQLIDKWIYTGDIVRLMDDGSFEYIGRKDDQVKNHLGEVVFLHEFERVVSAFPEVRDTCCINLQDKITSITEIILFVVTEKDDSSAICYQIYAELDRIMGPNKRPDDIVFIEKIQRLTNGKVDRKTMHNLYQNKKK